MLFLENLKENDDCMKSIFSFQFDDNEPLGVGMQYFVQ
jgi:hypothetical protein